MVVQLIAVVISLLFPSRCLNDEARSTLLTTARLIAVFVIASLLLILLRTTSVGAQSCDPGYDLVISVSITSSSDPVMISPERSGYVIIAGPAYMYELNDGPQQLVTDGSTTRIEQDTGSMRIATWGTNLVDVLHCQIPDANPTPTIVPSPTAIPITIAYPVPLEYYVVTGTNQIASDMIALGAEDNPAQPILFGFGALMLGCFVLIFVRVLVGSR